MAKTFLDVTEKQVAEVAGQIKEHNPDRTLCLSGFSKVQVFAPTKSRKTHKFKFEVEIPSDTFIGDHLINDFGGMVLLDIVTNRIQSEYLKEK